MADKVSITPDSQDAFEKIDAICDDFEAAWKAGEHPKIDDYLARGPEREELFAELLKCEVQLLTCDGQEPQQRDFLARFPDFAQIIQDHFGRHQATYDTSRADADDSESDKPPGVAATDIPDSIGRFKVRKLLGQGTFGRVFLAHDDELDRDVAIKVPHAEFVARPEYVKLYRKEARTVASLEKHLHIVQVYHVDSTDEHPFFVVSQYIEGEDLMGNDSEGTVDSSHPTGLGFFRQAEVFQKVLRPILDRQKSS